MNTEEKQRFFDEYNKKTHRVGRICASAILLMLCGAPFIIGIYLGAMPNMKAAGRAFLAVGIFPLVSSIFEYLLYVPMLGAGGSYLGFITGNILNLKIPSAINARDIVGAKSGTAENEIISTLSIAASSLVTVLIIALGVLLMVPLQPVLQSPQLQPAFEYVVPALFGAMAYKYFKGNMKIAIVPLIFMSVLFILAPGLTGSTSTLIIPSGGIAITISYLKFIREQREKPGA
jgi:hypothetical protein